MDSKLTAPVIELADIAKFRRTLNGQKIAFTNGCFDVIHAGHIYSLQRARECGDFLWVGLNSDASVARLKGPSRPINSEVNRAAVLSALRAVDAISIFQDDTPADLIAAVRPDVLVKGGDYEPATIVGADFVRSYGGEVRIIKLVEGLSSTNTIDRLANN